MSTSTAATRCRVRARLGVGERSDHGGADLAAAISDPASAPSASAAGAEGFVASGRGLHERLTR
jgi:hypothetical protein